MAKPSPRNRQPSSGQLSRPPNGPPQPDQDPTVESADEVQQQDDTTGQLFSSWGITGSQSTASQQVRSGGTSDRCATGTHFPEARL